MSPTRPRSSLVGLIVSAALAATALLYSAPPAAATPFPTSAQLPSSVAAALKTTAAVPSGSIFVATTGVDTNPGTLAKPLKTLKKAISMVKAGGTIVLRNGVYKEGASGHLTGGTYYYINVPANVTIRSYPNETVWFEGTAKVSAWTRVTDTHYTTPWSTPNFCATQYYQRAMNAQTTAGPCSYGDAVNGTTVLGDPQMAFRNGSQLTQVHTLSALTAGTFFYDWAKKVVHIGFNPSGQNVELTKFAQAAAFFSPVGLKIHGIGFRRYASNQFDNATAGALLINSGSGVVLDGTVFTENAGSGIMIWNSRALTIRRSYLLKNGANGLNVSGSAPKLKTNPGARDDLLVEYTRVEENNTGSFGANCTYGCNAAGAKLCGVVGATVRYSSFSKNGGNRASGLWFDLDNREVRIYGNQVVRNARHGIVYEVSDTGVIASNLVTDNGFGSTVNGGGYGIFAGSNRTRIYNNTLVNNKNGVMVYDDDRSPVAGATRVGPNSTNVELVNNVISTNLTTTSRLAAAVGGTTAKSGNASASAMLKLMDNNSYAKPSSVELIIWRQRSNQQGVHYKTLPELRAAQGAAREARGEHVTSATNPFFVAAATGDYSLKAGAVGAGRALPADIASMLGVPTSAGSRRGVITLGG